MEEQSDNVFCSSCKTCFDKNLLKLPYTCPMIFCKSNHDNQNVKYGRKCEEHGLINSKAKNSEYKCPVFNCKKSTKKGCPKCKKWISASNFSKRKRYIIIVHVK